MNKGLVIGILVVLALAAVIVIATRSNSTGSTISNSNTQSSAQSSSSANASTSMKLSDTPYWQYSYLISGNTLSANAQNALAGFQRTVTQNSDGTTTYTLTALQSGYVSQTYTLKSGQSLYFIERSMGDDDTTGNTDYNLGDDMAVVVDSNGNIVQ